MDIMITNVRLSFPALFEAEEFEPGSGKKYGCTLLLEKSDPQVAKINAAIDSVGSEKFADKWPAIRKTLGDNNQKICFFSGDTKTYDGYAGMMALTLRRAEDAGRPMVIDRNTQPLVASDGRPYGGCFVNAKFSLWAQSNKFGKTVRATLVTVQFARDGSTFSGAAPASAEGFEILEDDDLV